MRHQFEQMVMEEDDETSLNPHVDKSDIRIQHLNKDIIALGLLTLVPMLIICILLVSVTFAYVLDKQNTWFRSVEYPNASSDDSAYYLSISGTRYVTISSWAGNVFSGLTGFVMILFSFLVAYRYNQVPSTREYHPTPFQLSLFFQARSGNIGSFWSLAQYLRWRKRERLGGMVIETYLMLFTALILRLVDDSEAKFLGECANTNSKLLYLGS